MRNLLERARAKLSRGGGGEPGSFGRLNSGRPDDSGRGEDLGRLNSGRGEDMLDSAPGSPVHVPRSKWRERLAVPDQQVTGSVTQEGWLAYSHGMQASDDMQISGTDQQDLKNQ